ncbi:hypothetical protein LR48_Vigan05g127000 [Vigna angularis]|uniref:Uncharacterized protein n=1 Tax=Phaseolus angularis TaxID=3914 RepID=A0A0L9UL85_PHAAN|nr:hypothetical protein LR48_Vigan05g127000 [Vigna angularis]
MKLALHCHGELELTMEEMESNGDPRKKKKELSHTQTCSKRSKRGVFMLQPPKDDTLIACAPRGAAQHPWRGRPSVPARYWRSAPLDGTPKLACEPSLAF